MNLFKNNIINILKTVNKKRSEKYKSIDTVYELIQKESDYELNRSVKLDNKINMTLTFSGVIFIYVVNYLNISQLIEFERNISLIQEALRKCCVIAHILIIVLYLFSMFKLINLLFTRTYFNYRSKELLEKEYHKESVENVKLYVSIRLLSAISVNHETNENRSNIYNEAIRSLGIMIIVCAIVEFIKNNFI